MNPILKSCLLVALVFCCLVQQGYGGWKQVGQFNNPASCGYFFDADNGIVGLGQFAQNYTSWRFISNQPLGILWTSDGGITWTPSFIPAGGSGRVTSIDMKDRFNGYAAIYSAQYSVWKTTDGGKSWTDFSQGNSDLSTCVYETPSAITKTIWYDNSGGSSTNGGRTYSKIFSGGIQGSNGIDFSDLKNGIVTMGPGGGSWITNDGGVSWQSGDNLPESWSVYALKQTKTFFTLPEDDFTNTGNAVYWTQNGGKNWQVKYSFPGTFFNPAPSFTGHIAGAGNTLYVQTDINSNQGLFRSDDLGATWKNVGGPSNVRDTRFAVTGCRGEVVYAFDDQGGVWKTTDGGDGAFGFTPRVGDIKSVKAGDTTRIPIYIDSTGVPFTINQFSGSFALNTDLLTPFGFDTVKTLSHAMIFDTMYTDANKNVNFLIKYSKPLKNGIPLSMPIIYIKAVAYVAKNDTTNVTLNSLNINSGASQQSLVVCSSSSNLFTLANECSDTTLRRFMVTGEMPKLLSIMPNPSVSGNITARVYLPRETEISAEIFDQSYRSYKSYRTYMTYGRGVHNIPINTSTLPSGEYFLKIFMNNGSYLSGRIVITR